MEKLKLTDEQKKTLKLFSYYCMTYGGEEVDNDVFVQYGDIEWAEYYWHIIKPHSNSRIEGYDRINDLRDTLIDEYNLLYVADDSDYYTKIQFHIDCKERILTIKAWQEVMSSENKSITRNIKDYESLNEFVDKMKSDGYEGGQIDFEGSGDSGYVNNLIFLDGDVPLDVPPYIEDFCYEMLSEFPGWEINEGSQGHFNFDFNSGEVELHYEQNFSDYEQVDFGLIAKF